MAPQKHSLPAPPRPGALTPREAPQSPHPAPTTRVFDHPRPLPRSDGPACSSQRARHGVTRTAPKARSSVQHQHRRARSPLVAPPPRTTPRPSDTRDERHAIPDRRRRTAAARAGRAPRLTAGGSTEVRGVLTILLCFCCRAVRACGADVVPPGTRHASDAPSTHLRSRIGAARGGAQGVRGKSLPGSLPRTSKNSLHSAGRAAAADRGGEGERWPRHSRGAWFRARGMPHARTRGAFLAAGRFLGGGNVINCFGRRAAAHARGRADPSLSGGAWWAITARTDVSRRATRFARGTARVHFSSRKARQFPPRRARSSAAARCAPEVGWESDAWVFTARDARGGAVRELAEHVNVPSEYALGNSKCLVIPRSYAWQPRHTFKGAHCRGMHVWGSGLDSIPRASTYSGLQGGSQSQYRNFASDAPATAPD